MLQLLDHANRDMKDKIIQHLYKLDSTKHSMEERERLLGQLAGGSQKAVSPSNRPL